MIKLKGRNIITMMNGYTRIYKRMAKMWEFSQNYFINHTILCNLCGRSSEEDGKVSWRQETTMAK